MEARSIVALFSVRGCMRGKSLMLLTASLHVVLAACASSGADALDSNQAASVLTWQSGTFALFTYTEIEKIDGVPLTGRARDAGVHRIEPGVRRLGVAGTYVGAFGRMETGRAELSATLDAGHSYQVKAQRGEDRMTLWVEDQKTLEPVTERKTTATTVWIKWFP